jgi:hypothetical protein
MLPTACNARLFSLGGHESMEAMLVRGSNSGACLRCELYALLQVGEFLPDIPETAKKGLLKIWQKFLDR